MTQLIRFGHGEQRDAQIHVGEREHAAAATLFVTVRIRRDAELVGEAVELVQLVPRFRGGVGVELARPQQRAGQVGRGAVHRVAEEILQRIRQFV